MRFPIYKKNVKSVVTRKEIYMLREMRNNFARGLDVQAMVDHLTTEPEKLVFMPLVFPPEFPQVHSLCSKQYCVVRA
jgi:hypothetical protein